MPIILAVGGLLVAMLVVLSVPGYQFTPTQQFASASSALPTTIVVSEPSPRSPNVTQVKAPSTPQQPLGPTDIRTLPTHNVSESRAQLRGEVELGTLPVETLFFVYGYEAPSVRAALRHDTYQQVLERRPAGVSVARVTQLVRESGAFTARVTGLAPDTTYSVYLCGELPIGLRCSDATTFTTWPGARSFSEANLPRISRTDVTGITADIMQLSATVDMNDMVDGLVYVVWGESESRVISATQASSYSRIREDDEQLQKKRLETNLRGVRSFETTIDDLESETTHYYAWCVEYDGLDDGVVCTRVRSFETYDEDFGQAPLVSLTQSALTDGTLRLSGAVFMRDFNNGQVFFAYGTDRSRVEGIAGERSLGRVRQAGDRLQVRVVDIDFDSSRQTTFSTTVTNALPDTTYYVTLCVEFENQNDRYRDAYFIECAPVATIVER